MRRDTWIVLAAVAVGGYVLYRVLGKGADKIAAPIADLWVRIASGPPVQVLGNAVLPDNRLIPLSNMAIRADTSEGDYKVYAKYGDTVYRLAPHDANGNYPATRVS